MSSKLSQLKYWLTLEDSAKYLSRALDEEVSVADLLHLALERKLTLSIVLVTGHFGAIGKLVSLENAELCRFSIKHERREKLIETITGAEKQAHLDQLSKAPLSKNAFGVVVRLEEGANVQFKGNLLPDSSGVLEFDEDNIQYIDGLWDLTMMGAEALDIEDRFHDSTGGPDVNSTTDSGVILSHPKAERWLKLYHLKPDASNDLSRKDFVPADRIPQAEPIVIRRQELQRFAEALKELEATPPADELEALPANFSALYDSMGAGDLPHLEILIAAWVKFWRDRSQDDGKGRYPDNGEVAEWARKLMDKPEKGKNKAKAIASIIRPTWAPIGRQPNHNE